MTDHRFASGDRVFVRHVDAIGHARYWDDGKVLDFVNSTPQGDIYRLTFGGFGVNFLMSEVNLRLYRESCDGEEVFRQDAQGDGGIQTREVALRIEERAPGEK